MTVATLAGSTVSKELKLQIESTCCAYCNRRAKDIKGFNENQMKSNNSTKVSVLYMDYYNRPICGRCVSENNVIIRNDGESVIDCMSLGNHWLINKRMFNKFDYTSAEEHGYDGSESLTMKEVDFKL